MEEIAYARDKMIRKYEIPTSVVALVGNAKTNTTTLLKAY